MSRRFAIDVPSPDDLPRPMPAAEAMRLAVESFRADADARRAFRIPLAALPTMARRPRYPSGFRAANECRKAEAAARCAAAGAATTATGRASRARYTPEERRARRAAVIREINQERARRANHKRMLTELTSRVRELRISRAAAADRAERELRLDALTHRMRVLRTRRAEIAAMPRAELLRRSVNTRFPSIEEAVYIISTIGQVAEKLRFELYGKWG